LQSSSLQKPIQSIFCCLTLQPVLALVKTMAASDESQVVQRYTKQDLEDLVSTKYQDFCKLKCAECGKPACKKFKGMMSLVAKQMLDSCWCNECGRMLCDKHRHQHTCERLDQQKERNKHLTKEQLAAQMAEAEAIKAAQEEAVQAEKRQAAEAVEAERLERKEKRKLLAFKARTVESFLQSVCRRTDMIEARGTRVRDELFEMYTRVTRLSLGLYNEYEHPSSKDLPESEWQDVKEIYLRSSELTGMRAMTEDGPLDVRNPWDPPPPADEAPGAGEIGLGRGVL